jgi:hypothetical protein
MKSSIKISKSGRTIRFSGPIANDVFKAMTEPKVRIQYRSVARWPDSVKLGNVNNESADLHGSREAAQAVCTRLAMEGFGGDRLIFPLKVWVEEVPDKTN